MSATVTKGSVFDPGLCRCCGTMRKCRVLNEEYHSLGRKEVYSDMIMDCFGLVISNLDGKLTERLICATCVKRLRECLAFRQQVLQCEEAFLQMRMDDAKALEREGSSKNELAEEYPEIKVEVIKTEPEECTGMDIDDHHYEGSPDEDEDMPLDQLAKVKVSPKKVKNSPTKVKNSPTKVKNSPTKVKNIPTKVSMAKKIKIAAKNERKLHPALAKPVISDTSMLKMQEMMRERDPTYMTETNILTIVEYSFVCPFKCRHNHLLCYYCGDHISDPKLLRDHTERLHTPKKFKVTEHKKMIKIDLSRIDCRLCPEKIDNLDEFKKHVSSVHNKKYYFAYEDFILPFKLTKDEPKCALCDMVFPYFHALNKHMNVHFSNFVCETCGLGFVDNARFLMHQQRHEQGDFPCQTCGKVFKKLYNRDLHVDRVHMKRGRVYCPKCDVTLMTYAQKLKHLVEVHGEEPLSFPCNMCERIFDTRRTLTIHRRKDHLKDYRYHCQYCGQRFFTRFALDNHMPTHTGERNFKCKVCEKCYPRLKTLKDHMRIHTNDRRYRCHICGQAFIQNCSLKGHVKSQHPEYG